MDELAGSGRVARMPASGLSAAGSDEGRAIVWVATERRALFEPLPVSDESLVEIVRGRLEGLGPVTASAIADSLALPASRIIIALGKLEAEGFAMRGRFGSGSVQGAGIAQGLGIAEEEWCERRLLARVHRYTVKRLRAEIEPVEARDFRRFLSQCQRVLTK